MILAAIAIVSIEERQKVMPRITEKETLRCPDKSNDRRPINHLHDVLLSLEIKN